MTRANQIQNCRVRWSRSCKIQRYSRPASRFEVGCFHITKLQLIKALPNLGDGLKLLRDFPKTFPTGISSLLELSHLARRVDPIGTGPGAQLISLANLGRAYLGREIDKDSGVRKGDWMRRLDSKQIDCAISPSLTQAEVLTWAGTCRCCE